MKIALINMFYKPTIGGVEQVMYELGQRLIKQGHEVHVFCCDSDKNRRLKIKEEILDNIYVHRLPYWCRLSLFTFIWPSLLWKLPKYKFDIIHSHVSGHLYILISGIICKFKAWKHIHTTHCPWTDSFRSWILKPFVFLNDLIFNKLSFKLCHKVIAITPWEFNILKKYKVTKKQLELIPNGMDDIHFKTIAPNNFKKRLGIKNEKLVLFFGRFNITKGADKFVLAAKEILKERNNIFFLMRGPDEGTRNKIENMTKNIKNIKVMYETRNKKEIAEMYQASDVYVLPSYREGLPLTLFEAMAAGLPIVATPCNGVPYEVKHNINGFLVNYGNINELKNSILKILDNKTLANKFSKANKEKSKNYNWNIICKKYEKIYEDIRKI